MKLNLTRDSNCFNYGALLELRGEQEEIEKLAAASGIAVTEGEIRCRGCKMLGESATSGIRFCSAAWTPSRLESETGAVPEELGPAAFSTDNIALVKPAFDPFVPVGELIATINR
ncbi:hypothetical protein KDA14_01135 [Candidatus Saccharibacteria bacterium]|nr:hypothetical protein [Candidatus Saccharibacteria bacterium]